MPRGFGAVQSAVADIEERKNSGGGGRRWFKLDPGESATVRFLEEGDDVVSAWVHQLPAPPGKQMGPTVPCRNQDEITGEPNGADCPGCEKGYKKKYQGVINLIWRDAPLWEKDAEGKYVKGTDGKFTVSGKGDVVAVWRSGIIVFDELGGKDATYKGLTSRDFVITRSGTGLNTKYKIEPLTVDGETKAAKMSKADEALAAEKTDLNEILAAPDYNSWGKAGDSGQKSSGSGTVAPTDTSPFSRNR